MQEIILGSVISPLCLCVHRNFLSICEGLNASASVCLITIDLEKACVAEQINVWLGDSEDTANGETPQSPEPFSLPHAPIPLPSPPHCS